VLVKLHVVSAFALLSILPFTALTRAIVEPVDRLARRIAAPVGSALRPAWLSIERRIGAAVTTASTLVFDNGEEEN
jgi:nitrate reductase gamma subunit